VQLQATSTENAICGNWGRKSEILLRVTYTGAYLRASRGEGEETEKDESDSTEDARWSELKKDEAVEPIQEQLLLETS